MLDLYSLNLFQSNTENQSSLRSFDTGEEFGKAEYVSFSVSKITELHLIFYDGENPRNKILAAD